MPIREPIVIEGECKIGSGLDTGYFVVIRNATIGNNCSIWSHCTVDPGAIIGNNVKLHNHVYVAQGTVIRDNVFVGPGVKFLNDRYPPNYDPSKWEPPVIGRGAVIGGGSTICPGVYIGRSEERRVGK